MFPTLQKAVDKSMDMPPLPQQQTSHTEQCYRQCETALQTPSCLSHIFRVPFHFWCWQYQSSSKVLGSEHGANYMTSGPQATFLDYLCHYQQWHWPSKLVKNRQKRWEGEKCPPAKSFLFWELSHRWPSTAGVVSLIKIKAAETDEHFPLLLAHINVPEMYLICCYTLS